MKCETCSQPTSARGAFVVCSRCRTAVLGERRMRLPRGFDIARVDRRDAATTYREPAPSDAYVISRAWWRRWVVPGAFLVLWGGVGVFIGLAIGIGPFVGGRRHIEAAAMLLMAIPVLAIGLGGLYVAIANLANRTLVEVTGASIARSHAPLRWWGAWVIPRALGDAASVRAVHRNDLRNAAAAWPTPRTFEVILVRASGEIVVLFEQIGVEGDAIAAAALVDAALAEGMEIGCGGPST